MLREEPCIVADQTFQVALPYKGIRIPQDLSFDSDAMQKLLDHSDHERRAQIVNFLATHPLFKKNR